MTAACFTKYVGNLTVYFDKEGELQDFNGGPVFLNRSIPEGVYIISFLHLCEGKKNLRPSWRRATSA